MSERGADWLPDAIAGSGAAADAGETCNVVRGDLWLLGTGGDCCDRSGADLTGSEGEKRCADVAADVIDEDGGTPRVFDFLTDAELSAGSDRARCSNRGGDVANS